jgi:hypothetical protein
MLIADCVWLDYFDRLANCAVLPEHLHQTASQKGMTYVQRNR